MRVPSLGIGLLLTETHTAFVARELPNVDWFELTSESLMRRRSGKLVPHIPAQVERIIAHYPVSLHGVSLSIGSVDPLDADYLRTLRQLTRIVEPRIIADHLCFTGVDGRNTHELLPLPQTREALEHVTTRVERVQEYLGRQLLLENPPSYITYAHADMDTAEFLSELARRTGCGLLVDLNNLHVSATNNGFDPRVFLRALPAASVRQFHLAGYDRAGEFLLDTHATLVSPEVWKLFELGLSLFGPTSTILEWDLRIPSFDVLREVLNTAKRVEAKAIESC